MTLFHLVTDLHLRVRELRLAAQLSQEALAARTDLSVRTIIRIEGGTSSRPSRSTLRLLATALGISVEELLGDENDGNGDEAAA